MKKVQYIPVAKLLMRLGIFSRDIERRSRHHEDIIPKKSAQRVPEMICEDLFESSCFFYFVRISTGMTRSISRHRKKEHIWNLLKGGCAPDSMLSGKEFRLSDGTITVLPREVFQAPSVRVIQHQKTFFALAISSSSSFAKQIASFCFPPHFCSNSFVQRLEFFY